MRKNTIFMILVYSAHTPFAVLPSNALNIPLSGVIISAPHGHCLPTTYRTCDRLALPAAHLLHQKLPGSSLFSSTHYREDTDLNREEGRVTRYRKDLGLCLKTCRKKRLNCIVCDMHSFPPDIYNTISGKKALIVPDLYFIQAYYDNELAQFLYNFMKIQGIPAEIFQGSYKNDILLEATYNHVPSVIIEFNEGLNSQRLQLVIQALAQGIQAYVVGAK